MLVISMATGNNEWLPQCIVHLYKLYLNVFGIYIELYFTARIRVIENTHKAIILTISISSLPKFLKSIYT